MPVTDFWNFLPTLQTTSMFTSSSWVSVYLLNSFTIRRILEPPRFSSRSGRPKKDAKSTTSDCAAAEWSATIPQTDRLVGHIDSSSSSSCRIAASLPSRVWPGLRLMLCVQSTTPTSPASIGRAFCNLPLDGAS